MKQYLKLMSEVMEKGEVRNDRTGVGTKSLFGYQSRYDLSKGFPMVTTKKLHLRSIIVELIWFLNGDTNIKFLNENKVSIWNEWADESGDLGPVYGHQWRHWPGEKGPVDQIQNLIDGLINNPGSRRHIVTAWNPSDVPKMALPPCHSFMQFYVGNDKSLSCQLYQRSADIFLGVPFNIASYALLTMMIAQVTGLKPGEFVHTLGDAHLYSNHLEQAQLQLTRTPYDLPSMNINSDVKDIFSFNYEDFEITNYQCDPHIKAKVAV